jgi:hypothetical protein
MYSNTCFKLSSKTIRKKGVFRVDSKSSLRLENELNNQLNSFFDLLKVTRRLENLKGKCAFFRSRKISKRQIFGKVGWKGAKIMEVGEMKKGVFFDSQ